MEVVAVATETGVQCVLEVDPSETVGELRSQAASQLLNGVDLCRVEMLFDGMCISQENDAKELSSYRIIAGSRVAIRTRIGILAPARYTKEATSWCHAAVLAPDTRKCYSSSSTTSNGITVHSTEFGKLEQTIDAGDREVVLCLALSPSGDILYTGHQSGSIEEITLSEPDPERAHRRLGGHSGRVYSMCVSPCGVRLYSCTADGEVCEWQLRRGGGGASERATPRGLQKHGGYVVAVALSHDGSTLYSGGEDAVVCRWKTGILAWEKAFETPGRVLAIAVCDRGGRDDVYCGMHKGGILRLDGNSGAPMATLRGHTGWVAGLALTPDGSHLLSCGKDGTLRVWGDNDEELGGKTFEHWLKFVAVSTCGQYVATSGEQNTVYMERLVDVAQGTCPPPPEEKRACCIM